MNRTTAYYLCGTAALVTVFALARPTLDDVFLRQTGRSLRETANA